MTIPVLADIKLKSDQKRKSYAERQAVNAVIQGSASDIMKRALCRIHCASQQLKLELQTERNAQTRSDDKSAATAAAAAVTAAARKTPSSSQQTEIMQTEESIDTAPIPITSTATDVKTNLMNQPIGSVTGSGGGGSGSGSGCNDDDDPCRILLQLHDEIVLEVDEQHFDRVAAIVAKCMESAVQSASIPFLVNIKRGPRLGSLSLVARTQTLWTPPPPPVPSTAPTSTQPVPSDRPSIPNVAGNTAASRALPIGANANSGVGSGIGVGTGSSGSRAPISKSGPAGSFPIPIPQRFPDPVSVPSLVRHAPPPRLPPLVKSPAPPAAAASSHSLPPSHSSQHHFQSTAAGGALGRSMAPAYATFHSQVPLPLGSQSTLHDVTSPSRQARPMVMPLPPPPTPAPPPPAASKPALLRPAGSVAPGPPLPELSNRLQRIQQMQQHQMPTAAPVSAVPPMPVPAPVLVPVTAPPQVPVVTAPRIVHRQPPVQLVQPVPVQSVQPPPRPLLARPIPPPAAATAPPRPTVPTAQRKPLLSVTPKPPQPQPPQPQASRAPLAVGSSAAAATLAPRSRPVPSSANANALEDAWPPSPPVPPSPSVYTSSTATRGASTPPLTQLPAARLRGSSPALPPRPPSPLERRSFPKPPHVPTASAVRAIAQPKPPSVPSPQFSQVFGGSPLAARPPPIPTAVTTTADSPATRVLSNLPPLSPPHQ